MKIYPLLALVLLLSQLDAKKKMIPAYVDTDNVELINLGPIGVRVETDHREERMPRSNSNSGIVRYIFENSLAEGKLEIGDEIIGINRVKVDQNFTRLMSEQISKSEEGNGYLELHIKKEDKVETVKFKLDRMGAYSETWPRNCDKSAKILRNACDWLVEHQYESGRMERGYKPERGNKPCTVITSVTGLALLGCDKAEYRHPIAKIVNFLLKDLDARTGDDGHYDGGQLDLWSINYAAIFLSEYYLLTNDKRVLKSLEFLNEEIYCRQFHQMGGEVTRHFTEHLKNKGLKSDPVPPYWFCHGKPSTESNGYIHLGANVANACVAWHLLERAGASVDVDNLVATLDYVEKACESGAMGYASRIGQKGTPPDAFGRTGTLGVALYLGGGREEYTTKVSESLRKQYTKNYYFSHATCVMGKAWGTLAMATLDPESFRGMMDEMKDDFNLLRLSDGSFVSNPAKKNLHGYMDLKSGGSGEKHVWTTAFNALIFTLGEGKLAITGNSSSQ